MGFLTLIRHACRSVTPVQNILKSHLFSVVRKSILKRVQYPCWKSCCLIRRVFELAPVNSTSSSRATMPDGVLLKALRMNSTV